MTSADYRSGADFMLLFIHCLLARVLVSQLRKRKRERMGCFALVLLWLSVLCLFLAVPRECDCGMSWSFSSICMHIWTENSSSK